MSGLRASWRRLYHRLAGGQASADAASGRDASHPLRWPALLMLGLGGGVLLGSALGLSGVGEATTPASRGEEARVLRGEALRVDARAWPTSKPARLVPGRIPGTAAPPPPLALPLALAAAGRPRIAIVIDDLGLSRAAFDRVDALPGPLTLAFLPYGAGAQAMLDDADPTHEAILHLPTEPLVRTEDAGPDMLRAGEAPEIRSTLALNLAKLDGFAGVNNHTGSRFTADPAAMSVLLRALDRQGLYFLDSVTTARPVAARLAEAGGFRVVSRDVFLDADYDAGAPYVRAQLRLVEAIARRHGEAVAIGHPYRATVDALGPWLVTAPSRGFDLVTVGALAGPAVEGEGPALTAALRD